MNADSTPTTAPLPAGAMPAHVAFIMDGNGRWAKDRGMVRTEGHRQGVETVRRVLQLGKDWGIRWISLYAFSTENWRRPETEVSVLFELLVEYLGRELPKFIADETRLHLLGDPAPLPGPARAMLETAIAETAGFDRFHVQIAINYGGREEIVRAVRRWQADPAGPTALDEESFGRYLDTTGPDPDLVVRTSGEQRISNFLLWQAAYAEYAFLPMAWPDFDEDAFRAVLLDFGRRTRRFGMTDEQVKP